MSGKGDYCAGLKAAMLAVCKLCRDGRAVLKGEWHEVQFTNPDETAKAYCLATPIRRLLESQAGKLNG